jgi:hypothetical protein
MFERCRPHAVGGRAIAVISLNGKLACHEDVGRQTTTHLSLRSVMLLRFEKKYCVRCARVA